VYRRFFPVFAQVVIPQVARRANLLFSSQLVQTAFREGITSETVK
jgi:hypothetical protein